MISYANNREDVLLHRLFPDDAEGFYIDVGAGHPVMASLTKHFSDRGWRGINVEPVRWLYDALSQERRRDINLNAALAANPGRMTLYEFPPEYWGLSTLSGDEAAKQREAGIDIQEREVEVTTLAEVCEAHVRSEIDFLSVDVEGMEKEVLEGGDWGRWRPKVVIVEATEPLSTVQSHHRWEPILISAGYLFAYFDGLNRFYVRQESAQLCDGFAVPVNLFDAFQPYEYVSQVEQLQEAAKKSQSILVAEVLLRESAEATLRSVWGERKKEKERLARAIAELEAARASAADGSAGGQAAQDVGPHALSVARVLTRAGVRYPKLSLVPKVLLRSAIRVRRFLA